MVRRIVHLAVGKPKEMTFQSDQNMMTGIKKQAVKEAFLTEEGFQNDGSFHLKYHGGPDRTVCIFPAEHYVLFEETFQKKLPDAAFGENLTVTNMLETDVAIGDLFQAGDAVFQVTEARNPCSTIAKYNAMPELYEMVRKTGYTGYLCRTIRSGKIQLGDELVRLKQDPHQITVSYCHEMILHRKGDLAAFKRILAVPALSERYRAAVEKKLK
ncbi:MOSC domain-containing protein [Listeria sp. PSOL-1]|uniref:MOSC domain-containing protein n=1 Tax=Listeria sp. PSOL-1 TaxID=1844999 RepID=UPI0013D23388|nr:MOSC domain-containing protein [Listeria sp. PSOL-1]